MLTLTDGVVLILLLYYGLTGWRKGFLRSLLGPFSLLVCIYAAAAYFQKTHNIFLSFSISFFGPFVINFLGSAIIRLIRIAGGQGDRPAGLLSRMLGASCNFLWGSAMITLMILLLSLSPVNFSQLAQLKADVSNSRTFAFLSGKLQTYLPGMVAQPQLPVQRSGPRVSPGPSESALADQQLPGSQFLVEEIPEAKAILEDERVKAMIADPEVAQLIKEKNYMQLLNNPKFTKILEDPQLVMKFLEIHRKMGSPMSLPGTPENGTMEPAENP